MKDDSMVNGMIMCRWLIVHSPCFTFPCLIHYILMSFARSRYSSLPCTWMLRKESRDEEHGRTNRILYDIHAASRLEQILYSHN